MPITVLWDDKDKTSLRWDVEGEWDWQLVENAVQQAAMLRRRRGHDLPVNVILNLENTDITKQDVLQKAYEYLLFNPTGRNLIVVVGSSLQTQALVGVFRSIHTEFSDKFLAVESLQAARQVIYASSSTYG